MCFLDVELRVGWVDGNILGPSFTESLTKLIGTKTIVSLVIYIFIIVSFLRVRNFEFHNCVILKSTLFWIS